MSFQRTIKAKRVVQEWTAPAAEPVPPTKCQGCEVCVGEEDDCGCIIGHEHTCAAEPVPTTLDALRCVKCASGDVYTRWEPSILECTWHDREHRKGRDAEFSGEHLHRTCRGCGYQWGDKPPLARPEPSAQEDPDD